MSLQEVENAISAMTKNETFLLSIRKHDVLLYLLPTHFVHGQQ